MTPTEKLETKELFLSSQYANYVFTVCQQILKFFSRFLGLLVFRNLWYSAKTED